MMSPGFKLFSFSILMLPVELYIRILSLLDFNTLATMSMSSLFFYKFILFHNLIHLINPQDKLRSACKSGNLSILRYIHITSPHRFYKIIIRDPWLLYYSVENNNLPIVTYLLTFGSKLQVASLNQACLYEDLNLVKKFVLQHDVFPTDKTLDICCSTGNIELVTFFLHRGEWFKKNSLQSAATYGHLHIVKLLINHGVKCNHDIVNSALVHNHTDIVHFLKSKGFNHSKKKLINHLKKYHP